MRNLIHHPRLMLAAFAASGLLLVGGCSSSPSQEELTQLQTLRDEVASLQRQVADLEKKRAGLEKELSDLASKTRKAKDDAS
jgi:outer membrane murein-binding lipoprotein Lpp